MKYHFSGEQSYKTRDEQKKTIEESWLRMKPTPLHKPSSKQQKEGIHVVSIRRVGRGGEQPAVCCHKQDGEERQSRREVEEHSRAKLHQKPKQKKMNRGR